MSYVTIETSVGSLTLELYTEHAPKVCSSNTVRQRSTRKFLTEMDDTDLQELLRISKARLLQQCYLPSCDTGKHRLCVRVG
jgi:hypothetical protein